MRLTMLLLAMLCAVVGRVDGQYSRPAAGLDGYVYPSRFAVSDTQIDELTTWLRLVDAHSPGRNDDALDTAAAWTLPQLQAIAVNAVNLAIVMRTPEVNRFESHTDGHRIEILYSTEQLRRLRALACVGGGYLRPLETHGHESIEKRCRDTELDVPSALASAAVRFGEERARRGGDDNILLFRAAMLHADVAIRRQPVMRGGIDPGQLPIGPRRLLVEMEDGRVISAGLAAVHWDIADSLLDRVRAGDGFKDNPSGDERVRWWYLATTTWMQAQQQYDAPHLERGRNLFPTDSGLMFLLGCEHEALAGTLMREGLRMVGASTRGQLDEANRYFERALQHDEHMVGAALHRGRVLGLLGRFEESATLIRRYSSRLESDPLLGYYAALVLGDAEEGRGRYEEARDAYQRAQQLFPDAQKPRLALSELAWRQDRYEDAGLPMKELFAHGGGASETSDPWSGYARSHARDADAGIALLWHALVAGVE